MPVTGLLSEAPIKVQLPPLHRGQLPLAKSGARFKVVICGRRFGKTTYGVRECTKGALKTGGLYWWIAPTYRVALIGWKMLKELAFQIPDAEVRESDMLVRFKNKGEICIKSADNPDSLRGDKLSGVVFDEFGQVKEETWEEVIRPALTDTRGWALFIGTPKGKNWAYRLFERAKNRSNWEAFKIPTAITLDGSAYTKVIASNNPYISVEELEEARQDYQHRPEAYAQEYLADFGASQYLVYPEVNPDIHEWRGPLPEFIYYRGGMDFGGDTIGAHKSTVAIAGMTARDELIIVRAFEQAGPNIGERQLNWVLEQHQNIAEVHRIVKLRPPQFIYRGDKTQVLGIQYMNRMGINIFKTRGGADSVNQGIDLVHARLKVRPTSDGKAMPRLFWHKDVHYVGDALMRYRYPEPRDAEEVQKSNPLKVDDDMVDAIRYMVEGVDGIPMGDPHKMYANSVPRLG